MKAYEKEMVDTLVDDLLSEGYTVYLAERGTYGFYTDDSGERVVSFGVDLGSIKWSGNYVSSHDSRMGTGWRLDQGTFHRMLHEGVPNWAIQQAREGSWWRYATVEDQLERYGNSSRYTKMNKENGQ